MLSTFQSRPNVLGSHPADIHGQRKARTLVYQHDLPTAPENAGSVWMRDFLEHTTNVEPHLLPKWQAYNHFRSQLLHSKSAMDSQRAKSYKEEEALERFLGANGVANVLRSHLAERRLSRLRNNVMAEPEKRERIRSHYQNGFAWQLQPPLQGDRHSNWPAYPLIKDAVTEAEVRQNVSDARLYDRLVAKHSYPLQSNKRSTTEAVFRFTQQTGDKFSKALARRRLPIKGEPPATVDNSVTTGEELAQHGKAVENLVERQTALQERADALTENRQLVPARAQAHPSAVVDLHGDGVNARAPMF